MAVLMVGGAIRVLLDYVDSKEIKDFFLLHDYRFRCSLLLSWGGGSRADKSKEYERRMIEQFKERMEIILKRMEFIRESGEFIEALDFRRLPPFDFFDGYESEVVYGFDMSWAKRAIIESVTSWPSVTVERLSFGNILKEYLRGRRFLIILDDVCVDNKIDQKWDIFLSDFEDVASQICLIITAGSFGFAAQKSINDFYVKLNPLSEEDGWPMLEVEAIGRKILRQCNGLPLRGYEFEKEKLVLLWMAEGLLQQQGGNQTMEEVGDRFCRILIVQESICRSCRMLIAYDSTQGVVQSSFDMTLGATQSSLAITQGAAVTECSFPVAQGVAAAECSFSMIQKVNNGSPEMLKNKLQSLLLVVDDAEEKQYRSKVVKEWLDKLRDVVYDKEDLIDEIHTEGLQHRLDEILDRVESFAKRKDELGLKKRIEHMEKSPRMPAASVGDDNSKLIYKDHRVTEHFDLKAWAYVSDLSDTFMVTKAVFESFTLQSCDLKEQDMSQLEANLCERLEGKRFLLVLNIASPFIFGGWEALQPHFIKAANGSYVIVTTRNEICASSIKPLYVYHIKPLSDEDSWSLFVNFAFGGQNPSSYPELEDIGRQIMEKCFGSP
uniref:Uncharacterized protein n=1 Tax=Quercus lobata TaxID=97700 RepID=A0A7N2LEI5_QUELO